MKKHITAGFTFAALAVSVYISACKSKKAATTTQTACSSTYTADIKSILDANCAATCHSAEKHKHNIDLSSYEGAKAAATGKSFLGSVRHEAGFDPMPAKANKLDDATIEKLACWVQNGMPK